MAGVLLSIAVLFFLLLFFFLFSSFYLEGDTRVPVLKFRWPPFGDGAIFFDGEWKLRFKILVISKIINLEDGSLGRKSKTQKRPKEKVSKRGPEITFRRLILLVVRILRTTKVHNCRLALDTGDFVRNAQLYPLITLPGAKGHLHINFHGENYFYFSLSNRPWNILYAWFK